MTADATAAGKRELRRAGLLVDETHQQLWDAIMRGQFAPGERLRDSLIAERLGSSRTPVREALRLLHQEGLVTKLPNRSYVVAEFTDDDLRELAAVRVAVESMSIRVLVHRQLSLKQIEEALDELRAAGHTTDGASDAAIVHADLAFHTALVEATGSQRLVAAYRSTRNQTLIALLKLIASGSWPGSPGSYEQHRAVLDSVHDAQLSGSPAEAIALLESHIHGGRAKELIGKP